MQSASDIANRRKESVGSARDACLGCVDQCTNEGGGKGSGTADARCLIGIGGPEVETAVVGLQNM